MPDRQPTRQRLLDEGMRLFAERGFAATTVGDIEAAAGLQPRRGALYKHFESKEALLLAALQSHLDSVGTGASQIAQLDLRPPFDEEAIRAIARGIGWWFLGEMDRQRELTAVLEHDGARLPALTNAVRDKIVEAGYRAAATAMAATAPVPDPEATTALLVGALVALRRTTWTFGAPPLAVSDERAVEAFAELIVAALVRF